MKIDNDKLRSVLSSLRDTISETNMITETSVRIGTMNECEIILKLHRLDDEWDDPSELIPKNIAITEA